MTLQIYSHDETSSSSCVEWEKAAAVEQAAASNDPKLTLDDDRTHKGMIAGCLGCVQRCSAGSARIP